MTKVCEDMRDSQSFDTSAIVWEDPPKVELQGPGGTFPRLALLVIIVAGLLGAIPLLGWLSIRLLRAAVMTLMLLMLAAPMALVAACGHAGRASCVACLKRGFSEALAKLVYSVFLAVVLLTDNLISSLALGFFATWLLKATFWWTVFLKRDEFVGFLSLDQRAGDGLGLGGESAGARRSGGGLMGLYYGMQMARNATRAIAAPVRGGVRAVRRQRHERAVADSAVMRQQAREELAMRARREATTAAQNQITGSQRTIADQQARQQRRTKLQAEIAKQQGWHMGRGTRAFRRRQLAQLNQEIAAHAPAVKDAQGLLANPPDMNRELGEHDIDRYIERRRRQQETTQAPEAAENLRAAGIMPDDYARARPGAQAAMRQRSADAMHRERELMERLGPDATRPGGTDRAPLDRAVLKQAWRESQRSGQFTKLSQRATKVQQKNRADARHDRRRRNVR